LIWDPSPAFDTLTLMDVCQGYWVNMGAARTLTITGAELLPQSRPPACDVSVGWNLMGFKSTIERTAGDYLAAINGKWNRIYGYDGAFSVVYSGDTMKPGRGYWIAVNDTGTIFP
jgi:hypothetical protein